MGAAGKENENKNADKKKTDPKIGLILIKLIAIAWCRGRLDVERSV